MNETVNKFLLVGDKFMPERHLKKHGFTYSTSLNTKIELKSLCRLEIQIVFTEMNSIKLVFNMIWLMVSKDLAERNRSGKRLRDKAFKIASDPKYDGYQRGLASLIYKFLDKKFSESGVDASLPNKSTTDPNYQLANELHKQIIRKFKRRKFYSSFRHNIWGVDLADM